MRSAGRWRSAPDAWSVTNASPLRSSVTRSASGAVLAAVAARRCDDRLRRWSGVGCGPRSSRSRRSVCAAAVDTPTVTKPKHGPVPCRDRGIVPWPKRYTRLSMGWGVAQHRGGTVPAVCHSAQHASRREDGGGSVEMRHRPCRPLCVNCECFGRAGQLPKRLKLRHHPERRATAQVADHDRDTGRGRKTMRRAAA